MFHSVLPDTWRNLLSQPYENGQDSVLDMGRVLSAWITQDYNFKCRNRRDLSPRISPPAASLHQWEKKKKNFFPPLQQILKAGYTNAVVPSIHSLYLDDWTGVVKPVPSPESPNPTKVVLNSKGRPRGGQEQQAIYVWERSSVAVEFIRGLMLV